MFIYYHHHDSEKWWPRSFSIATVSSHHNISEWFESIGFARSTTKWLCVGTKTKLLLTRYMQKNAVALFGKLKRKTKLENKHKTQSNRVFVRNDYNGFKNWFSPSFTIDRSFVRSFVRPSVYIHWFHWLKHCIHWPLLMRGRHRRHFLLHFDFDFVSFRGYKIQIQRWWCLDNKLI